MSPSDGYFGQRSPVPDTVFLPSPHALSDSAMGKTREAAAESAPRTPVTAHQPVYTPNTTAPPSASSRRDSASTHDGYGRGYRDGAAERVVFGDDPPPVYTSTPTEWSQSQHSPTDAERVSDFRDASNRVRHTIPPSQASTCRTCHTASPRPKSKADRPVDLVIIPEYQTPLLPVARKCMSKKQHCYGRRRQQRDGPCRRCKRGLCVVVGIFVVIWLIGHWAMKHHHGHSKVCRVSLWPLHIPS